MNRNLSSLILLVLWVTTHHSLAQSKPLPSTLRVEPIPTQVREQFKLDPFYQKQISLHGLPIVAASNVTDHAVLEAAWLIHQLLHNRTDLLQAMAKNNVRFAIMAYNQYTTDIPEHRHLTPKNFWDRRARGLGATPSAPAVSCGEENLLGYPGDPYSTENLLIHEFAHAIHEMGLRTVDPTFDRRLEAAFKEAMASGKWKGTYAATNRHEYFAEGVQSWFDNNRVNDAIHNHVNTRVKLKEYDPALAALCQEVFGDGGWRYQKPQDRDPVDRAHLAGFSSSQSPTFQWRETTPPPIPTPATDDKKDLGTAPR